MWVANVSMMRSYPSHFRKSLSQIHGVFLQFSHISKPFSVYGIIKDKEYYISEELLGKITCTNSKGVGNLVKKDWAKDYDMTSIDMNKLLFVETLSLKPSELPRMQCSTERSSSNHGCPKFKSFSKDESNCQHLSFYWVKKLLSKSSIFRLFGFHCEHHI